uniref:Uncharacterized protein n=1 Tax=Opuntia streptacantha TaxID=393608 RepID=A0A7C9EK29_OPUST
MKLIFLKFLYQSCILSSFLPNLSLIKKTQCYLRHLRLLHPLLRVAGLSISPASCSVALQRLSRVRFFIISAFIQFSAAIFPPPLSILGGGNNTRSGFGKYCSGCSSLFLSATGRFTFLWSAAAMAFSFSPLGSRKW